MLQMGKKWLQHIFIMSQTANDLKSYKNIYCKTCAHSCQAGHLSGNKTRNSIANSSWYCYSNSGKLFKLWELLSETWTGPSCSVWKYKGLMALRVCLQGLALVKCLCSVCKEMSKVEHSKSKDYGQSCWLLWESWESVRGRHKCIYTCMPSCCIENSMRVLECDSTFHTPILFTMFNYPTVLTVRAVPGMLHSGIWW